MIPLLLLTVVTACGVWYLFTHVVPYRIDVGGQGSPQQVYFGTEYTGKNLSQFFVPIELLAGLFFTLIALVFVGLGQVMGRAFDEAPDRLLALYQQHWWESGWHRGFCPGFLLQDTARSLVRGCAGPVVVLPASGGLPYRHPRLVAILVLIGFAGHYVSLSAPFQAKSSLQRPDVVAVLQDYCTRRRPDSSRPTTSATRPWCPLQDSGPAYDLLHLLNRDAGGKPFEDVLIIGAGSGNDVAGGPGKRSQTHRCGRDRSRRSSTSAGLTIPIIPTPIPG